MKRFLVATITLALTVSLLPVATAAKAQNNWTTTQKIIYVGLTPKSEPDFWTAVQEDTTASTSEATMLSYAKSTVDEAITFWKQTSRGKMKFGTSRSLALRRIHE